LGVSDRHYFGWLAEALAGFERASGRIRAAADGATSTSSCAGAAVGGAGRAAALDGRVVSPDVGGAAATADAERFRGAPQLWVLAAARMNPALEVVRDAMGRERTAVRFFDRFERGPGVTAADLNALGSMPDNGCDVLVMTRASYLVADPPVFLADLRRIVRPSGLAIVDWLHGAADAPRLNLPGHHDYEGRAHAFRTTYCDAESLARFPDEFGALIAHVNRPPPPARLDGPGARALARLRQTIGFRGGGDAIERGGRAGAGDVMSRSPDQGSPGIAPGHRADRGERDERAAQVTRATYLAALRDDLGRAGKHLVEAEQLATHFTVVFRHARYMYPRTGRFYLHLLTALQPVGT
jgi:hypothetical protein